MAAMRLSCTIWYWSLRMPSETCLWAMRSSIMTGSGAFGSTSWVAKVATEAASAFCCAPCFWLPRLKVLAMSSGCAVNILL